MSTLTAQDVVQYTNAFQAKYGRPTTLTVDDMEAIIMNAEADMSDDDFAEAFAEAEAGTADIEDYRKRFPKETKQYSDAQLSALVMATEDDMDDTEWSAYFKAGTLPDDRSRDVDTSKGSAYSYAIKFDKTFEEHVETLANAAIENKRGGAVIMLDLFRIFGAETVCQVWPMPGSRKPGQGHTEKEVGDNEPWDMEDTTVTKVDGTSGKGTKSFYSELVALSAHGKALLEDKEKLAKEVGSARDTKPRLEAVKGKINNFKASLTRAVNLAQRMAFVNASTGMSCELIMDGSEVVASNKVIFIQSKTDKTKFDVITIGQFLALKVSEGKPYSEIVGTVTRKPRAAVGNTELTIPEVTNLDVYDKVTAAYATFFDKMNEAIKAKDMKAYNALLTKLNSAGSDDLLLSMNTIMNSIEAILSKPGISKRLGDLLADGAKADKAA